MTKILNLTLTERYVAKELLPTKSTFVELKCVQKAISALAPNDETRTRCKAETRPDGSIQFDKDEAAKEEKIELEDHAFELLKSALRKLDDDKNLEGKHFTLYEKIVEGKNDDNS